MTDISSSNAFLIVNEQIYRIKHKITTIGRSLGNHLVLTDPIVSRQHAQIRLEGKSFVLYDLNSTGGTYVNGKKINKSVLKNGDSILLSSAPVVFAQNFPQLGKKAKAVTGELRTHGPDDEPTLTEKKLDWRI